MADVLAVGVHGVLEGSRLRLPGVPSPKSLGFRCVQNGPPARREEGAYLKRYVTDEQRSRRPIFIATLGPWPVGCFSALLAPYVSIQDTLVATASPARTALKNSQLTCGDTYAYFGDRTLAPKHLSAYRSSWVAGPFTHLLGNEVFKLSFWQNNLCGWKLWGQSKTHAITSAIRCRTFLSSSDTSRLGPRPNVCFFGAAP